jgi:hypothetical protein
MKNTCHLLWAGIFACSIGICPGQKNPHTICKENRDAGFALIQCQPLDATVRQGEIGIFTVQADGNGLAYQWYFRGQDGLAEPVGAGTSGGQTPELMVFNVDVPNVGAYWCEIDSLDPLPARTRTRDARLSIGRDPAQPDPGNPIQTYLPQPASMPPGNSGAAACGSYCGWINYYGPNNAGFDPATATPALTKGLVKVRIGDTPNEGYRHQNSYRVYFVNSTGGTNCAVNSLPPAPDTQKEFPINPNKNYWLTVYFVSSCPPANTNVWLELSFVP